MGGASLFHKLDNMFVFFAACIVHTNRLSHHYAFADCSFDTNSAPEKKFVKLAYLPSLTLREGG